MGERAVASRATHGKGVGADVGPRVTGNHEMVAAVAALPARLPLKPRPERGVPPERLERDAAVGERRVPVVVTGTHDVQRDEEEVGGGGVGDDAAATQQAGVHHRRDAEAAVAVAPHRALQRRDM